MKALIQIQMDNAAFDDINAGPELARILADIPKLVEDGTKNMLRGFRKNLHDTNGNVVGTIEISR